MKDIIKQSIEKELNKRVENLSKEIYRKGFEDIDSYFKYLETTATKEFTDIYSNDTKFVYLSKDNVLRMFRMNLKHRFVPMHSFGILIDII